jgi:benzodiazapine receptor
MALPMNAAVSAAGICFVAAVAEGLAAGRGAKSYFETLRYPRFSPPLKVWYVVGGLYYVVCFAVLYLVLKENREGVGRTWSVMLVVLVMALNALWTFTFFRLRSLSVSTVVAALYAPVAVALFAVLWQYNRQAAWVFFLYMMYLIYAGWWSYGLWRANRR